MFNGDQQNIARTSGMNDLLVDPGLADWKKISQWHHNEYNVFLT